MPIVEPVEVCSETTGPAHGGDLGWPQAASKRKPGDEDQSDAKAIAYRLPSPTSVVTHEMPSPFCLVPGTLANARLPHSRASAGPRRLDCFFSLGGSERAECGRNFVHV
jgi:hypothetical protein